jgi:hypothetical protein
LDRQTGVYLFGLASLYSLPLWVQSVWVELDRGLREEGDAAALVSRGWPSLIVQGAACGLAFAAILVLRSRTSLDFIYFQF